MKYVIIEKIPFREEMDEYHIEKIDTKEEIIKIIEENIFDKIYIDNEYIHDHQFFLIVTDDYELLSKYIFTINEDELKMLCDCELEYDKTNIRINKQFYPEYYLEIFEFYKQINDGLLLSANLYTMTKTESWDHFGQTHYATEIVFAEWIRNIFFKYSKRNLVYNSNEKAHKFVRNEYLIEADYKKLSEIFSTDFESEIKIKENLKLKDNYYEYRNLKSNQTFLFAVPFHQTILEDRVSKFNIETEITMEQAILYRVESISLKKK